MRFIALIMLLLMLSTVLIGCGRQPTGETDYNQLRQGMQAGENPPPAVPAEKERQKPAEGSGGGESGGSEEGGGELGL